MNDRQEQNAETTEEPEIDRTAMHQAEYKWADRQVDYSRLRQLCETHHLTAQS